MGYQHGHVHEPRSQRQQIPRYGSMDRILPGGYGESSMSPRRLMDGDGRYMRSRPGSMAQSYSSPTSPVSRSGSFYGPPTPTGRRGSDYSPTMGGRRGSDNGHAQYGGRRPTGGYSPPTMSSRTPSDHTSSDSHHGQERWGNEQNVAGLGSGFATASKRPVMGGGIREVEGEMIQRERRGEPRLSGIAGDGRDRRR